MNGGKLQGRVALITGASRNIGRAVALAFAGEGADLLLNTRVNGDELETVAAECRKAGIRVVTVLGNVGDPSVCQAMVERGLAELGEPTLDHRLADRGIADVAEDGDDADTGLSALGGDRLELVSVHAGVQQQICAFARERERDGAADVAAGAGAERDPSLELAAVHRYPAAFSLGNTASRNVRISCSGPTKVCSGM